MLKLITQYKGLRKELYVLFVGRIVTNMGSMIWPILTLILTQKLGMTAAQTSIFMIIVGAIGLPLGLLGGKLADKYNKKHIIVTFDLISIIFYIVCAFVPLSFTSIILLMVGSFFQQMEGPSYETLVADITKTEDRERAYSLTYLGMNIGLVASPTIAGFLFKDYLWLSFLISGLAIGVSTLLIAVLIRDITPVVETTDNSAYQKALDDNITIWQILKSNKLILLYVIGMTFFWCAYNQWSFLLPIDMATVHGADLGAKLYGMVNSENCIIVVLFTPIITHVFSKLFQTRKMVVGEMMVLGGYIYFLIGLGHVPTYFIAIALFTMGEIFMTISSGPYTSERIPASHRGRVNGVLNIIQSVLAGFAMFAVGNLHTYMGSIYAWGLVFGMIGASIVISMVVVVLDKRCYPKLYSEEL